MQIPRAACQMGGPKNQWQLPWMLQFEQQQRSVGVQGIFSFSLDPSLSPFFACTPALTVILLFSCCHQWMQPSGFFGDSSIRLQGYGMASYLGLETFCGSLRGQYFIFGALCPSKSGLMNKHIVKHRAKVFGFRDLLWVSAGSMFHFWCPVPV